MDLHIYSYHMHIHELCMYNHISCNHGYILTYIYHQCILGIMLKYLNRNAPYSSSTNRATKFAIKCKRTASQRQS